MSNFEKCDRCGVVGVDRRTLWMACLYAMNELGVPFEQVGLHGVVVKPSCIGRWGNVEYPPMDEYKGPAPSTRGFFLLRVCKGCRGSWMEAIQKWFREAPDSVCQYNNDQREETADVASLVAELERLRTDSLAIQQNIESKLAEARRHAGVKSEKDADQ